MSLLSKFVENGLHPSLCLLLTLFTKGQPLLVYENTKEGECYMAGCKHAFQDTNACLCSICMSCLTTLKKENEPESSKRVRGYVFPGCENHSFLEMALYTDKHGAYWCTEAHRKEHPNNPRPQGCVHCLCPYHFCGSKKAKMT